MVKLVTTSQAARELGISASSLTRWAHDGVIEPELVTPGGHMRWDVDRLRARLKELRERDQ